VKTSGGTQSHPLRQRGLQKSHFNPQSAENRGIRRHRGSEVRESRGARKKEGDSTDALLASTKSMDQGTKGEESRVCWGVMKRRGGSEVGPRVVHCAGPSVNRSRDRRKAAGDGVHSGREVKGKISMAIFF